MEGERRGNRGEGTSAVRFRGNGRARGRRPGRGLPGSGRCLARRGRHAARALSLAAVQLGKKRGSRGQTGGARAP
jgi:hypothetical protein